MSYTPEDAAWDEFYDRIDRELYPQHKEQAIEEFTTERLQSFYNKNPEVASYAVRSQIEANALLDDGHVSASFVFAVSAIEQFLKAALLKPVVYGLVHHEALAELIVELTMGQAGFERYNKLLARLFESLAGINLEDVKRPGSAKKLLDEVSDLQRVRNKIIHQGIQVQKGDAKTALDITAAVFLQIVVEMLGALGLRIEQGGKIVAKSRG
jgi:hypothetical protein